MSTNLYQCHQQWASRPADQRFTSLTELNEFCKHAKDHSASKTIASRLLSVAPIAEDPDHKALVAMGPKGEPTMLTNWTFGQIAQLAKVPAGYMKELPADLAADCVNYGLRTRDVEDVKVLLYKNGGGPELRAVTGPNYGRVWNATITDALVRRFGNGRDGDFRIPGEFGQEVEITKQNTTLYASDRDLFVFLADEKNRITMPNRRNGESGTLARGFFVWNSEVGSQTLGIAMFLYDYACSNRIVWGAEGYQELRIRHTASAPHRWIEEVAPVIEKYAASSTMPLMKALEAARNERIGDPEAVDAFLLKRFSKSQTAAIKAAHLQDEQRPIETLWDAATGITAYARDIQFQDSRVALEREAGKIIDLVA